MGQKRKRGKEKAHKEQAVGGAGKSEACPWRQMGPEEPLAGGVSARQPQTGKKRWPRRKEYGRMASDVIAQRMPAAGREVAGGGAPGRASARS